MEILQTNLNSQNYNRQINCKAAFPVVHWVAEVNGSYAPIAQKEVVEGFQARLINFINANLKKIYTDIKKLEVQKDKSNLDPKEKKRIERKIKSLYEILDVPAQRLRGYLASADIDYRLNSVARSFYNVVHGSTDSPSSTAYIITGNSVADFEEKYCREFGKQKSIRKKRIEAGIKKESLDTPEYKRAEHKYHYDGFDYVNYYPRRIKNGRGETQTLHTKFVIERDKDGKFLDYKFIDARFLPERGPGSPFSRLGIKY